MSLQLNDQSVLAVYTAQKSSILDQISIDQSFVDAENKAISDFYSKYPNVSNVDFYHFGNTPVGVNETDVINTYTAIIKGEGVKTELNSLNSSLKDLSNVIDQQTLLVQKDLNTQAQLQSIQNATVNNNNSTPTINKSILDNPIILLGIGGLISLGVGIILRRKKK